MPDLIDAFCSQAHYEEHLSPILAALPDGRRGRLYAPRDTARELQRHGIPVEVGYGTSPSSAPVLVAGYQDLPYGRRPKVLVNHGAGQTYRNVESGSFAGGPGHEMVDLFLCPNQRVADLEAARYGKPAVAVGCPKLDRWTKIPRPERGPVAVTFHWPSHIREVGRGEMVPEAGNAWELWRHTIEALAKEVPLLGHSHPRHQREMSNWWASIGVEYVPNAIDLLPRAVCLILDNSSLGFEWAALDRPTVWLRGDGWRDIHGPPRFAGRDEDNIPTLPGPEIGPWALGSHLNAVAEIRDAIITSCSRYVLARERCAVRDYGGPPGGAAQRAANAVLSHFHSGETS